MVAMRVRMSVRTACAPCGRDVLTCRACGYSLSEHVADPPATLWCPHVATSCETSLGEWCGPEARVQDDDEVTLCSPCAAEFDDAVAFWNDSLNVAYERARARGWED